MQTESRWRQVSIAVAARIEIESGHTCLKKKERVILPYRFNSLPCASCSSGASTHMAPVVHPLDGHPQEPVHSNGADKRVEELAPFPLLKQAHVAVGEHGEGAHLHKMEAHTNVSEWTLSTYCKPQTSLASQADPACIYRTPTQALVHWLILEQTCLTHLAKSGESFDGI